MSSSRFKYLLIVNTLLILVIVAVAVRGYSFKDVLYIQIANTIMQILLIGVMITQTFILREQNEDNN